MQENIQLYCTVLYCTVLYCTVLYCTVLQVYICAEQYAREHPARAEEEQLHLQLPGAGAALQVTLSTAP